MQEMDLNKDNKLSPAEFAQVGSELCSVKRINNLRYLQREEIKPTSTPTAFFQRGSTLIGINLF